MTTSGCRLYAPQATAGRSRPGLRQQVREGVDDISAITEAVVPLSNTGRFFIHGEWTKPTSDAVIDVIDSATEQLYFQVPEAQTADMDLIIGAARRAFDRGPWPRMTHAERAGYLRAMADMLEARASDYSAIWPRESGVLYAIATAGEPGNPETLRFYTDLADDYHSRSRSLRARPRWQVACSACSCASPSGWWVRSSRGTPRCRSSSSRSRRRCWPDAR